MPDYDFRAPRLFVDATLAAGATVALERDQSNYLGNVLRLKSGDGILVFNGRDGEWQASLSRPQAAGSTSPSARGRGRRTACPTSLTSLRR